MLFHYQIRNYYLCASATDMRKGIDALAGVVTNELGKNPLTGDLFIFINHRKNQVKMLHWQGDGYAVFYKRLEKGTYEIPLSNDRQISCEQILFLLQGVVLTSVKKRKRYSHCFVNN